MNDGKDDDGEMTRSQARAGDRQRNLTDLAGSWIDDPAFEEVILEQEQIDRELWE